MNKTLSENPVWRNYKKYYISQSTAFITPILFLYVEKNLGVSTENILKIAAIYWFLSLFLQLPCGILADKWGTKRNLFLCLILQSASCLVLIFFQNPISYHFYLFFIYLAQSFCSNTSSILMRKHFKEDEDKEFKEFSFKLQNSFYLITSLFIVASSYLYTINEKIPFILQVINFMISGYYLSKIPEIQISQDKTNKNLFNYAIKDIIKASTFIFIDGYYFFLVVCSIIFGLGISINQKEIQGHFYSLLENKNPLTIGILIAIGNLFSSLGSRYFYKMISNRFEGIVEHLVLCSLLIFSFILMSFDHLVYVVLGFMVINIFKGCYRPLLSSDLINKYPFKKSINTCSALVYTITILGGSLLQILISFTYKDQHLGNILFAVITIGVVFAAYLYSKRSRAWVMRGESNILSGKRMDFLKRHGNIFVAQVYEHGVSKSDLLRIRENAICSGYPIKKMLLHKDQKGFLGLGTLYLGDVHLSDIRNPSKQYSLCKEIIHSISLNQSTNVPAKFLPEYHIFPPSILSNISQDNRLSQKCMIHGDLHPGNIMVHHNKPFVIDWDLSGNGPIWYDLLSLLSHPDICLDKEQRFELFSNYCSHFNYDKINELFYYFNKFKIAQLTNLIEHNPNFLPILQGYKQLTNV